MSAISSIRPVVAVTGLAFEARIAAGAGVTVVHGADEKRIVAALEAAIARGCAGVISFGTAGGLAPDLDPGRWVVAAAIVSERGKFPTHSRWSKILVRTLPDAILADIAGVNAPVADAGAKSTLYAATGAAAADMESHIAAGIAAAHTLPFAVCRVIIDPAHRSLPPAALVGLRPDGSADVAAVLRSIAQQPGQLRDLVRTVLDAWTARAALLRGRRMLGERLGLLDLG